MFTFHFQFCAHYIILFFIHISFFNISTSFYWHFKFLSCAFYDWHHSTWCLHLYPSHNSYIFWFFFNYWLSVQWYQMTHMSFFSISTGFYWHLCLLFNFLSTFQLVSTQDIIPLYASTFQLVSVALFIHTSTSQLVSVHISATFYGHFN